MENENPQEEASSQKVVKKLASKKSKQDTVLKQLNNQNLYPLGERVGIYVIAVLSTIGLALITYTGVMAVVSSTTIGSDAAVDVDVDDLQDILDEFEDLEVSTETEEPAQNTEEPLEDVETEVTEIPTEVIEPEETEVETEVPTEEPTEEDTDEAIGVVAHEPFTATINSDEVSVFRSPGSDLLFRLHTGDEVTVLDLNYNAYWARIEFADDPFDHVPRFVRTEFIDVE